MLSLYYTNHISVNYIESRKNRRYPKGPAVRREDALLPLRECAERDAQCERSEEQCGAHQLRKRQELPVMPLVGSDTHRDAHIDDACKEPTGCQGTEERIRHGLLLGEEN